MRGSDSAWLDLVFHGLAHLAVDPRDASGLYHPGYVAWAAARLPGARRTLPRDAAGLAALYDRAADAPLLQALAILHDDARELEATAARPFGTLAWPDAARAALARRLAAALPEALVDLFRIALWGEVRAGYLDVRERELAPRYAAGAAAFATALAPLARRCPWLAGTSFRLSHPLLTAGRAFDAPGRDGRLVVVGLEDAALGVPRHAPVIQAVHESMVALVQDELAAGAPAATGTAGPVASCRADRPGFAAHLGPEVVALCLGAELLAGDARVGDARAGGARAGGAPAGGALADAHEAWLDRLQPGGVAGARTALARAGLRPRRGGDAPAGPGALARWLAAGDAVPAEYDDAWQRARRRLASAGATP